MMFQKMLRLEELEQCPNCRRILYYVPPRSREAEGSQDADGKEAGAEGTR